MSDHPDDSSDRVPELGEPAHPEVKSHEALPISAGTKDAIKKLVEAKLAGIKPDPEFDNDSYLGADIDDPDHEAIVTLEIRRL